MPFVRATDGVRLHYNELGRRSGPPVLMIQGLAADKTAWTLQRLALASRYRTIALDNRGAGRSDKPYGDYSLEQMAQDAMTVLDHAGVETAHVMGASMGGAITEIVGVRHADRVRSLTLACTACNHHQWRKELLAEWADTAIHKGMGSMTSEAARWVIGPRSFRRVAPAIGWMGPLAFSRPPHAFAGQVAAILSIDDALAAELSDIAVPTLVIVGNQDILTPRGDSEDIADRIPLAELVVISGAAHGLMVEHATTFNRVLLEFLGRAEATYQATRSETHETARANAV